MLEPGSNGIGSKWRRAPSTVVEKLCAVAKQSPSDDNVRKQLVARSVTL